MDSNSVKVREQQLGRMEERKEERHSQESPGLRGGEWPFSLETLNNAGLRACF